MATATPKITFTHQGREIVRALATLNDQHSFFLFLEYQFSEQLQSVEKSSLEHYTSQVFNRNPFGPRIHVKVGKLETFVQANRGVSFGAYLSTSYEVASGLFERAYTLLNDTNHSTLVLPRRMKEGPEVYYRRVLVASGYSLPPQELLDTLTFVRLRRNAIVHLSALPSPSYQAFTAANGAGLTQFWKNSKVQIDFTTPTLGPPLNATRSTC